MRAVYFLSCSTNMKTQQQPYVKCCSNIFFELLLGEQATASLVYFYNIVRQFSLSYFEIFFFKKKLNYKEEILFSL